MSNRGLPVGTINKYNEMKMPDGTWRWIKKPKGTKPAVEQKLEPKTSKEVDESKELRLELGECNFNLTDQPWNFSQSELKEFTNKKRVIVRKLKKLAPEVKPGETYTPQQWEDSLGFTGAKVERPKNKFIADCKEGYHCFLEDRRVTGEEVENLQKILKKPFPGIYNYFNKSYSPGCIQIEELKTVQEEVKSSNITTRMTAPKRTYYRGTFKVRLSFKGEPITITTEWDEDTTLSVAEVSSFMRM